MELSKFNEIVSSGDRYIIVLSSEFCQPCNLLHKSIDTIFEGNFGLREKILREDVLECGEIVSMLGVMTVPTVIFVADGAYTVEKGNLPSSRLVKHFD